MLSWAAELGREIGYQGSALRIKVVAIKGKNVPARLFRAG